MLELGHKKLDVWQRGMELVVNVYSVTERFPRTETFALVSQLRRAAVSVPSNIAEGASRSSAAERRRFYEIARSSLVEIDTQLEIAIKLGYCRRENLTVSFEQMRILFASLSRLIEKTK